MEQTIEVTTWVELRELPAAMDRFAEQLGHITHHAVTFVCRRDGFEPSPTCVLRPLAEAMDPLRAGCETVGRWFADDWADLRAGVAAAVEDLGATDDRVAAAFPVVA
ncbi:MAG TPA: hypothetical protein VFO49_07875 [Nocardioides sp.]|nr:hypothetical protein [Nocardioides sp.]